MTFMLLASEPKANKFFSQIKCCLKLLSTFNKSTMSTGLWNIDGQTLKKHSPFKKQEDQLSNGLPNWSQSFKSVNNSYKTFQYPFIPAVLIAILITGIFPRAGCSKGAHGSQSDYSRYPCAVVFTSPLTSRLCFQLRELQELPTSPLRMWSSSKKHQLLLTWAPGPRVEPESRGHKADALPLSYPHTPTPLYIFYPIWAWNL